VQCGTAAQQQAQQQNKRTHGGSGKQADDSSVSHLPVLISR